MTEPERQHVGERGQIALRKKLREEFDISPGDEVKIRKESGKIVVELPVTREDLAAGYRARAEQYREVHEELKGTSREANEHLGDT
jgi:AbrB family looped-hinge helix DNA binding protein